MSIPPPNPTAPPRANAIGSTEVITGSCKGYTGPVSNGMLVHKNRLWRTCKQYYTVIPTSAGSLIASALDGSSPRELGKVGPSPNPQTFPYHSNRWAGYLVPIPKKWCAANTPGQCLAAGNSGGPGNQYGSSGPALFAFDETDPSKSTPLVYFTLEERDPRGWSKGDDWYGAVWPNTTRGSAVIFAGRVSGGGRPIGVSGPAAAHTDPPGSSCCYGEATDCTSHVGVPIAQMASKYKGYHCDPYAPRLRFIDPAELEAVAKGTKPPTAVDSYGDIDIRALLAAHTPGNFAFHVNGLATDGQHLFVSHSGGDLEYPSYPRPQIHVFRLPGVPCEP
jgi:hypothetical protein